MSSRPPRAAQAGPAVTPELPGALLALPGPPGDAVSVHVPLGWRVMVLSDLGLTEAPEASSQALTRDLAQTLQEWDGPGVVVVCGGLFAPCPRPKEDRQGPHVPAADHRRAAGGGDLAPSAWVQGVLESHAPLRDALAAFASHRERRILLIPSPAEQPLTGDPGVRALLDNCGLELAASVQLHLATAAGERLVVLRAGDPDGKRAGADPGQRPWLAGVDRLEHPARSGRFVTSRLLYRRLGRHAWWLLVPVLAALLLRLPLVLTGLTRLFGNAPGPRHALYRAQEASWATRLAVASGVTLVEVLILTAVLAFLSRRVWVALGGGRLPSPWREDPPSADVAQEHLDEARGLIAAGAAGLIVGGTLQAELIHLGEGFVATPGGTAEVVREHRGRMGLPPVFLPHLQASFLELETGAGLHVRLLVAQADLPDSTRLERLAAADRVIKGHQPAANLHPVMVGSWPRGSSWPPPPDRVGERRRARRARRLAAAAIFLAGLTDLTVALTPPLRAHLHLVTQYLPLGVSQAAGALVALAGIGLMMLARGILRGQQRAWRVAVLVLAASTVLHLVRAADVVSVLLSVAVLILLVIERSYFRGATDRQATRSAVLTVVVGAFLATWLAVAAAELTGRVHHLALPAWPLVTAAVAERLVGLHTIALPDRAADFLGPSMLTVGIALVVVCLFLATRPVVDRGLSATWAAPTRWAAERRARDIAKRHGTGSLDYFALRDDKQWFFHRDGLVAYAVYGGICLVSPDPICPVQDRAHIWGAFRHFADRHGWGVALLAVSEEWLPIYRDSGMHHIYMGDEALVDVQAFSLKGGKMKGLRQACTRLARYGYRVEFFDPSKVQPELASAIVALMERKRRGEGERGFSMCLSRIFDRRDAGLLLTVVFGPDGAPAAMCQFVPSPGIGGYSLDLMRRDPGEHPNGLIDFALCSTIEHLQKEHMTGLSLNFAAMRSVLEGEGGDGMTQRVERWALRRMSGMLPIESLWKFNAKYEPSWIPRYIVYDSPEQIAPAVAAILRAESLSELPVIGRFLNPSSTPAPPGVLTLPSPLPSSPTGGPASLEHLTGQDHEDRPPVASG